jgi:hypothetical protein
MRIHFNGTRRRLQLMVILLVITLWFQAGCLGPLQGTISLREAQDKFNQASRETLQQYKTEFESTVADKPIPPESPREKYQQVIHIVDSRVLPKVDRDDLKVTAYTLKAFAYWQIGKGEEAKITAEEGLDLYLRSGLATNRRDYGMLLILPGLVDYSEAYQNYQVKLKGWSSYGSAEEARQITGAMEDALKKINTINSKMEASEPIAIYANYQQLKIIRNILDVWEKVQEADPKTAAACDWSCKGEKVLNTKFPKEDFPEKDTVMALGKQNNAFKQPACACPSN